MPTSMSAFAGAAATNHWLVRPRILRCGATAGESVRILPGAETALQGSCRSTMATTISATPEQIWRWLVQVGWSGGASYSYNRIGNLPGMDTHKTPLLGRLVIYTFMEHAPLIRQGGMFRGLKHRIKAEESCPHGQSEEVAYRNVGIGARCDDPLDDRRPAVETSILGE